MGGFAILLALSVALPAEGRVDDQGYPFATAPDGHRGLGERPDPRALRLLFRTAEADDARFLGGLFELGREVEILVAISAARYERRGYFAMLGEGDPLAPRDLDALHRRFEALLRAPMARPLDEAQARAFARALIDRRFRARMGLIDGRRLDLRQLRGSLALLIAHAHGRAEFESGEELATLVRRCDLAAARLRALRLDLEALYEPAAGAEGRVDPPEVGQVVEAITLGLPSGRRTVAALDEGTRQAAGLLLESLFTPRFDRAHARALEFRDRALDAAQESYLEMRRLLPLTPEGRDATSLAPLKHSERYRRAADTGAEGLLRDPLHGDIHYLMGLSVDFFAGRDSSIPYFDRFLALRGVRHWDHRTFAFRELDDLEEYALLAVVGWRPPVHEERGESDK